MVCPACGGRATFSHVDAYGKCYECRVDGVERSKYRELHGAERAKALAGIAAWFEQHPTAWDRATDGLRMFGRHSELLAWP